MKRVVVIIPVYNESEVIADTIQPLLSSQYEVVVVDDGSRTNVESFIKHLPVHYLRHEINLGQGAALQTGMAYAKRLRPDFVVHYDADGQHNASDIASFIHILETKGVDIVLGSRFLRADTEQLVPFRRRMLLKTARLVNWFFTGLLLTDAHNGFRVMKGDVLHKIEITENRMAHATEMLRLINAKGLSYVEAPAEIRYTAYSLQKGQKASHSANILLDLLLHRFV